MNVAKFVMSRATLETSMPETLHDQGREIDVFKSYDPDGYTANAPFVTGGVEGPVAGSWPVTCAGGCPMLAWAWTPAACAVAAAPISA